MTHPPDGREAQLVQHVCTALQSHFTIHHQVRGIHPSGKRLRIDAIAVPHDQHLWARTDIALGIEFKAITDRPEERRDRKENAKIISQCIDYSLTHWDGFGVQPIFFCPGFAEVRSAHDQHCLSDPLLTYQDGRKHGIGYMMAAILGQNNVGELAYSDHLGWAFLINGTHRLWSQRLGPYEAGLGEARQNKLLRKIGSR